MNVEVVITAGQATYDLAVTDTGPDGMALAIKEATANFLTVLASDAGKVAAAMPRTSDSEE